MVCSNNNHRHNMAFRAYFIILLFIILVPCFTDCRAIIDEEIPQISKGGRFPSKFYTKLKDLTKIRNIYDDGPDHDLTNDKIPTDRSFTNPPSCLRCYHVPTPCLCHK
ncbi:hypothetical protein M5K25_025906 [Dendrobium thyrsiflorum]|uniref:Uncharacterized protein n=1 Tax=Dendrobium thyrsiflorum TaxID=117978 RepID=A0ABD0TW12_DENTH